MLPIATEVLAITEQNPNEFVSIVNDEFFSERKVRNPNEHLKAMIILARSKLFEEIATSSRVQKIETTVHRSFKNSVFSASFLLDDDMNFIFLTYFGEKMSGTTTHIEALIHVMTVLDALELDLDSPRPRNNSQKFGERAALQHAKSKNK